MTRAIPELTLAPKIYVPAVRAGWVPRPDLLAALNDAADTPLVTVVAPAGYGKSTLLALWHADPGRRRVLAVLTVDGRDNDPVVLWSEIIAALAAAVPDPSWAAPARLLRQSSPDIDADVLPALRAALTQAAEPPGVTLALDDLHLVTEPACHQQLAALTAILPPDCQLLLATRHQPPVPLARVRANGRLLELGPAQLCLTESQAAALTGTVSGQTLPVDALHALTEITEGWPAAVYLAARALRGRPDAHAVLSRLTSIRSVDEYIAEEILDGLPPAQAAALARTAVLERCTIALCRHVADADLPITEHHKPVGLPLIPLDDTHEWFRHHHLVRQALLRRLRRDEPDLLVHLHRRAAAWYAERGLTEDAIDHTLAGGDTDAAIELIATAYMPFINSGRRATVRGWLDRLGDDAIARSAPAAIVTAWIAALNGDRTAVAHWLRTAERLGYTGQLPDRTASDTSAVAMIRATFGFDGFKTMDYAAHIAVEQESDPTSPWYGSAQTNLAYTAYLGGRPETAVRLLENAVASNATMPMMRIIATGILSLAHHTLGHHDLAADLATTACRLAEDTGLQYAAQISLAYSAQAAALAHRGEHRQACTMLERILTARRRIPGLSPWPTLNCLTGLAQIHLAAGDRSAARSSIEEARALIAALPDPDSPVVDLLDELSQQAAAAGPVRPPGAALSEQEHALLCLLPTSLTLRQIAALRHVTVNTVKTQTQAIYRKLGAANRSQAVGRARARGLIPLPATPPD